VRNDDNNPIVISGGITGDQLCNFSLQNLDHALIEIDALFGSILP
jgi:hypothetical protein